MPEQIYLVLNCN